MIASMLNLSRSDCRALQLKDVYSLHKVVYSLFPRHSDDGVRTFLFADKGGDFHGRRILILSQQSPQTPEWGTISSKKVTKSFLEFNDYAFEIVMNPVTRSLRTGKLVAVRGNDNLQNWFQKKVLRCGFEVDTESLQAGHTKVITYTKNGMTCTHGSATFKGKLKVTDRDGFIKSFQNGIGRAKAFGFGLLQIAPLSTNSK